MPSKFKIVRLLLDAGNLAPLYGYEDFGREAKVSALIFQKLINDLGQIAKDPKVQGRMDYILDALDPDISVKKHS